MKDRIDFLVIGVEKAGTTALHHYLEKHPMISMSSRKELNYFFQDENKVGSHTYNTYHRNFKMDASLIEGEISPGYICHIDCPKRIYAYKPDIKLILVLRNPIERAYSNWNMRIKENHTNFPFWWTILFDSLKSFKTPLNTNISTNVYRKGLYSYQINNYYKYFKKDQVLMIKYDDYSNNQKESLHTIFEFLGVDSSRYNYEYKEVFKLEYQKKMSTCMRKLLQFLYQKDIKKVEKITSWDCSDWN